MTAVEYKTSKSEYEPLNSIPGQSYKPILIIGNKVLPPLNFAGEPIGRFQSAVELQYTKKAKQPSKVALPVSDIIQVLRP